MTSYTLSSRWFYEDLGDDVLLVARTGGEAIRLNGPHAQVVRSAVANEHPSDGAAGVVQELRRRGILVGDPQGLTRRSVVLAGAGGAFAGVTALALPTAAMASSTNDLGQAAVRYGGVVYITAFSWPDAPTEENPGDLTIGDLVIPFDSRAPGGIGINWETSDGATLTALSGLTYPAEGLFTIGGVSYRVQIGNNGDGD